MHEGELIVLYLLQIRKLLDSFTADVCHNLYVQNSVGVKQKYEYRYETIFLHFVSIDIEISGHEMLSSGRLSKYIYLVVCSDIIDIVPYVIDISIFSKN